MMNNFRETMNQIKGELCAAIKLGRVEVCICSIEAFLMENSLSLVYQWK